jgi:hypothetical protein
MAERLDDKKRDAQIPNIEAGERFGYSVWACGGGVGTDLRSGRNFPLAHPSDL